MSDRNTTVVTDGGAAGVAIGVVIAIVLVFGFLVLAFGWPFSITGRSSSGPTVNIQRPAPPAPAPALPAPAPKAPAPAR